MADPTREEIEAKIESSKSQVMTEVVRLDGRIETMTASIVGKLDTIGDKIASDHEYAKNTRWTMVTLIITAFLAMAGLIVGMAAYGDAMFGRGMDVHELIQSTIRETLGQQNQKK